MITDPTSFAGKPAGSQDGHSGRQSSANLLHFMVFCLEGNLSQVKRMVQSNKDFPRQTSDFVLGRKVVHTTGLHLACLDNHVNVVKFLIDQGSDPNFQTVNGFTPLYTAAFSGHYELVDLLLSRGAVADTGPSTKELDTPLKAAEANCKKARGSQAANFKKIIQRLTPGMIELNLSSMLDEYEILDPVTVEESSFCNPDSIS